MHGMSPVLETIFYLHQFAYGRVLDLGTGPAGSALIAASIDRVESVLTVENNPRWYIDIGHHKVTQLKHTSDDILEGVDLAEFDFVFVDHFPFERRGEVASRCFAAGLDVLVDDVIDGLHLMDVPLPMHRLGSCAYLEASYAGH